MINEPTQLFLSTELGSAESLNILLGDDTEPRTEGQQFRTEWQQFRAKHPLTVQDAIHTGLIFYSSWWVGRELDWSTTRKLSTAVVVNEVASYLTNPERYKEAMRLGANLVIRRSIR